MTPGYQTDRQTDRQILNLSVCLSVCLSLSLSLSVCLCCFNFGNEELEPDEASMPEDAADSVHPSEDSISEPEPPRRDEAPLEPAAEGTFMQEMSECVANQHLHMW